MANLLSKNGLSPNLFAASKGKHRQESNDDVKVRLLN